MNDNKLPWYFSTTTIVIGFLCVGPLILPLVWIHPRYSINKKILLTVVMVGITWLLVVMCMISWEHIKQYYDFLPQSY